VVKLPPKLKRLLSIAFFAALVFLGARIFAVETADSEIVFRLRGEPIADLQEMEVHLFEVGDDEPLGEFRKYYERGSVEPLGRWPLVVSEGDYRLEVEMRRASGSFRQTIKLELVDGQAISAYIDEPRQAD
jgi:hypothetical protein